MADFILRKINISFTSARVDKERSIKNGNSENKKK
jgi:hypothetical protein